MFCQLSLLPSGELGCVVRDKDDRGAKPMNPVLTQGSNDGVGLSVRYGDEHDEAGHVALNRQHVLFFATDVGLQGANNVEAHDRGRLGVDLALGLHRRLPAADGGPAARAASVHVPLDVRAHRRPKESAPQELVHDRGASAAPSVPGEAGGTDVEAGAGVKVVMITISDVRDGVLSISASSLKPEGTSVSSSGLDMSVQSRSLSISGEGKTPEGLIRPGGSPPRPRRTGAAGHSAALATGWPFQQREAAGL